MSIQDSGTEKKLFVLDTNVLIHDPYAEFNFHEHDIFIPLIVIKELDNLKKGLTEKAANVRLVSRLLDDMIGDLHGDALSAGIRLIPPATSNTEEQSCPLGKLYLQSAWWKVTIPQSANFGDNDTEILSVALSLQSQYPKRKVILVSKDINTRIRAAALDLCSEDYEHDQVLVDASLMYKGIIELPEDFWHVNQLTSNKVGADTYYYVEGDAIASWHPNLCVYETVSGIEAIVCELDKNKATLRLAHDFSKKANNVWGITARNREQNFALNFLDNDELDFVTIDGVAGTGKTVLTLATALHKIYDKKKYTELIMTRETVSIGEDIGFLPGTEEEKMAPWMGALMDNLELLESNSDDSQNGGATRAIMMSRVKIRSLNFMRGRTFLKRFLILDEAQNLTPKQMKTLITRAGPGTKIVVLGNNGQIDTPYLTASTSGLTYLVERFKNYQYGGHITMVDCERSRLADYASEVL